MSSRLRRAAPIGAFAALCYVPLLLTAPGWVVADTKSYLTIDPARLLSRAASMWDPHVAMGTVTHQNIGYLWPMGPYYWLMDTLGAPDWVAQRVWMASILFFAGLGVWFLLRTFGWRGPAVAVPVVAYALTPYVLSVAARISALLLPFAALPWMLALTIRALRSGSWHHPALFALVVTTVGTSNATAIILAGVGPVLWLVYAVAVRDARVGAAVATALRIGALTLATSAWWLAGVWVQATNGLNVLRYTETAEVVASASLAHEVLRGLGYWFFYGDDRLGPWIEPSVQYTQWLWLIGLTFLIPTLGLLAAVTTRWRHRAFFVGLLLTGMVLAVGAHPFDDPSPVGRVIKEVLLTDSGLALRSLPRAAPLVALSLAVLLGAGAMALARRRPPAAVPVAAVLVGLSVAAFPPLWQRGMVPANLRRPEQLPSYWHDAAAHLDATDDGTRVLEIPGIDFSSYRWGNTVDPVTTGLTDRPVVARELVPYGSPPSANLLNAFDARLNAHIADPESFAPVARLMRAGHVLVRSDLQYERFNTARPREMWQWVLRAPGLGRPEGFGPRRPNVAVEDAPMRDELALTLDPDLPHPPEVAVLPVRGALPIVAAKPTSGPVVVAGDGAGLVDSAAAGVIDGNELIFYSAALDRAALGQALDHGASLVLTDSNRRTGERWGSVRYNRGYTETAGFAPLRFDASDNRLSVFPDADDDARTVALHRGGITAAATSYGNAIEFTPEDRAANAVDGDPTTAWRTGAFGPVVGERLELTLAEPARPGTITFLQPTEGPANRYLTEVRLRFDGDDALDVALGPESRAEPGQVVDVGDRRFRRLEIEITADTAGSRPRYGGLTSAGFAEVRIGELALDEVERLPVDLLSRAGARSLEHPLAIVVTRRRAAPTEVTRGDEELQLARAVELPARRSFSLLGDARLSPRAPDELVDTLLGLPPAGAPGGMTVTASARMAGVAFRPSTALDGDPSTMWSPPFGPQRGHWIEVDAGREITVESLQLQVVADGKHSVPTRLAVEVDGARVATATVPPVSERGDAGDGGEGVVAVVAPLDRPARGRVMRFVIDEVQATRTVDWYSRGPVVMPVAIAELGLPGVEARAPDGHLTVGCRSDLVTAGGRPVPVTVTGTVADAVAGRDLSLSACEGATVDLPEGRTILRTAQGRRAGIDIDRITLRSAAGGEAAAGTGFPDGGGRHPLPRVEVIDERADRIEVRVRGAQPGRPFWLTLGQSHNDGWRASAQGRDLGDPRLVDGFANGWLMEPTAAAFTVELRFVPQQRVWVALGISAIAAVACAVLALIGWRRRPVVVAAPAIPLPATGWRPSREPAPAPSPRRLVAGALAAGVLAGAVLDPLAAPLFAVAAVVAARREDLRRWGVLIAPASLALAALYVIAWQLRYSIPPGFEWPSELHRAHPLGWIAVLVLGTDVIVRRVRHGARPPERDSRRRGL